MRTIFKKYVLLTALLALSGLAVAQTTPFADAFVLSGGDFSMVPPAGWAKVDASAGGPAGFFLGPKDDGYQRSLQVLEGKTPRFIDKMSLEEYSKKIDEQGNAQINMVGFRVRNEQIIKLDSGVESLVYYAGYRDSGTEMMQMHVIVSSSSHYYHIIYSDIAEHFEREDSVYLAEAWNAISNVSLQTVAPWRYEGSAMIGIVAGMFLLIIGSAVYRGRKTAKEHVKVMQGEIAEHGAISASVENPREDFELENDMAEDDNPEITAGFSEHEMGEETDDGEFATDHADQPTDQVS